VTGNPAVCPAWSAAALVWPWSWLALMLALATAGCGPVTYTVDSLEAERVVARARAENAVYFAPYDLYFAEAHLDKAPKKLRKVATKTRSMPWPWRSAMGGEH